VHAVCVESTHFHVVVTDSRGELSEFMRWLDRHIALCLMEHYRASHPHRQLEGIWSKQPFGATLLLTHDAIVDKIVYTLTNPVKDGLVRDYRKWPGVVSRPGDWVKPVRYVRRPALYFDDDDQAQREVPASVSIPLQFHDREPAAFVRDVEARIRDVQRGAATTLAAAGRTFMGDKTIVRQDPFDAPNSRRPRHTLNPRLAAGGNHDAMRQGVAALRLFREKYRGMANISAGARGHLSRRHLLDATVVPRLLRAAGHALVRSLRTQRVAPARTTSSEHAASSAANGVLRSACGLASHTRHGRHPDAPIPAPAVARHSTSSPSTHFRVGNLGLKN
jgi:putative transposase